ncbi:MAG: hypothetical protein SGARI_000340 [Bacillariaceae sp.]
MIRNFLENIEVVAKSVSNENVVVGLVCFRDIEASRGRRYDKELAKSKRHTLAELIGRPQSSCNPRTEFLLLKPAAVAGIIVPCSHIKAAFLNGSRIFSVDIRHLL